MEDTVLIGILGYCLFFAVLCGYVAALKGKDAGTWVVIGFFLGILGLLLVMAARPAAPGPPGGPGQVVPASPAPEGEAGAPPTEPQAPPCPLEVRTAVSRLHEPTGTSFYTIGFLNRSRKPISSIQFSTTCYASLGGSAGRPGEAGQATRTASGNGTATFYDREQAVATEVSVRRVVFTDGSVWSAGDCPATLLDRPGSPEEMRFLAHKAGPDAVCYARRMADEWVCVCGWSNGMAESECGLCQRPREQVLEKFSRHRCIEGLLEEVHRQQSLARGEGAGSPGGGQQPPA